MKKKFKVGDKVRCIKESIDGFEGKVGRIYEILKIGCDGTIKIKEGSTLFNEPNRFELVEELYSFKKRG